MTYQKSNLLHATVLIFTSLWMYYDALNKDIGLLIPFLFGVVLLSLNNGIMYENVQQRNAALGITIISLIFVASIVISMIKDDRLDLIVYYGILGFTSILSIIVFIFSKRPHHRK